MFMDAATLELHRKNRHGVKRGAKTRKVHTKADPLRREDVIAKRLKRKIRKAQLRVKQRNMIPKRDGTSAFNKRGVRIYENIKCDRCSIKTASGWKYKVDTSKHVKICNYCKAKRDSKKELSKYGKSRVFVQGGGIEKNRRKF